MRCRRPRHVIMGDETHVMLWCIDIVHGQAVQRSERLMEADETLVQLKHNWQSKSATTRDHGCRFTYL